MTPAQLIPFDHPLRYDDAQMLEEAARFADLMRRRRSIRHFSTRNVPIDVIWSCIEAAGSAPSGANQQPWHFVVVQDGAVKTKIRGAAEEEEYRFYHERAPQAWLDVLAPLGTDEHKPFLEEAPYLIAVFAERYALTAAGERVKNYYVQESVGLAVGMLITALHRVGLSTLTHTPSPMGFLNEILGRPRNEHPFLLLVVGYPAAGAHVPQITKKPLDEIATLI